MKTCIICRLEKADALFNDEHVIPDSIGGYYHIYSVCASCNSDLGSAIDNKLTNHKFIEFQRFLLNLKGKSGNIPNPFAGTHTIKDEPNQRVQLHLDENARLSPKLLPNIPREIPSIGEPFTIALDKADAHKSEEILDKFLSRNGLTRDQVKIEQHEDSSHPYIHINMEIDLQKFKMGILKIAYEFTVDKVPEYFNDPFAKRISEILWKARFDELDKLKIIGDGLQKAIFKPFEHLFDFKDNNHYLILFDTTEFGLLCFVNLFNVLALGFIMSEKSGYIKDGLLVLKNDIGKMGIQLLTMSDVVANVYSPMEYNFQYQLPDRKSVFEFKANEKSPGYSFFSENGTIPFFDANGNIKYPNIDLKLKEEQLKKEDKGDFINEIRTEITLDEELYLKLLPINKLYRVVAVQLIQRHTKKL